MKFLSLILLFFSIIKAADYNSNFNYFQKDSSMSIKPAIFSTFVPGSGQWVQGNKIRAGLYFSAEILGIALAINYKFKAEDMEKQYKAFAEKHWSFENWIANYYSFHDPSTPDSLYQVFINDSTKYYPQIWDGSHGRKFRWDDNPSILRTTDDGFVEIYKELCGNTQSYPYDCVNEKESVKQVMVQNNFIMIKDHTFYEDIGKYTHFFSGWDDSQEFDSLYIEGVNLVSPNRKEYTKNLFGLKQRLDDKYEYAINFIFINHFISMFDALITSKNKNNFISKLDYYYKPSKLYNSFGTIYLIYNF